MLNHVEITILVHMQRTTFATIDGIVRQYHLSRAQVAKALASLAERLLIDRVGSTRWFTRIDLAA